MPKRKVAYVLHNYPILADAFIEAEIRAVSDQYEVLVIVTETLENVPEYKNHSRFIRVKTDEEILEAINEFKPNVIHAHKLFMIPRLEMIYQKTGIPFTVRSHANDSIPSIDPRMKNWMETAPVVLSRVTTTDACLGILNFPFTRQNLLNWGVPSEKLYDCRPVVDFDKFYNPEMNGDAVINMGSYLPKKRMDKFLELAKKMPDKEFKLYALSSRSQNTEDLKKIAIEMKSPAKVMDPPQPEDLPAELKKSQWYVYFGDKELANFGWPVSVGEAQASGVGVCMMNLRPDLRDYIGEAGYLFNSEEELMNIISKPFTEEMRKLGYENAKKSDIKVTIKILLDLWIKAK